MRVVVVCVGIALFLLVFFVVVWLVVKHPTNLIFGERTQLEYQAMMKMYGRGEEPITALELEALRVTKAPVVNTQQLPSAESESKQ